MTTLIARIRSGFRAFRTAERGNVAVTFTLALIPIMGFLGAAVDFSRANAIKAGMQQAVDATALMLSKDVTSLTNEQIGQKATDYFNAMYTNPDATSVSVTPTYTPAPNAQLVVTGTASVATTFMKAMGQSSLAVNVSSTVKWGNTKLRVALALDTTGSMAYSSKLVALKTATKNLLTQLQGASSVNGDVYVSIIPFSKDVNVGSTNYNQSWVRFDDGTNDSWDAQHGSCSKSGSSNRADCTATGNCSLSNYSSSQSDCTSHGTCSLSSNTSQSSCEAAGTCSLSSYSSSQTTCTSHGTCSNSSYSSSQSTCTSHGTCTESGNSSQSSCVADGHCSVSTYTTQSSCTFHHRTWYAGVWTPYTWTAATWTPATWTAATWTAATWTPSAHSTWNGCVTDRDQDYDTTNTPVSTGTTGTLAPAEQYGYCPAAMMGLSYDWTALTAKVNALYADGSTNQAIGMQWAFMSLTSAPFTIPAKDANYKYTEVIILLTDGLNTQDRWYGNGYDVSPEVDARQTTLCSNVKTAGITLYTIQVNTGNDATSTLLQNCASNTPGTTDHFFLLTSSNQIVTTFAQIGTQLSNLRVSQ